MALAGIGAGINELTALAVTSELAPTRKRGKYVAVLVFTILPFCPSVLWAQLIASRHGWRYCGALCGAWAAFGLLMTLIFYHPPPRVNSQGLSRMQVVKQIDFVGGFLSVSGMLLFMAGLQWGGYQVCRAINRRPRSYWWVVVTAILTSSQYPWRSAHVLAPLLIGVALIAAFFVWEWVSIHAS